MNKNVIRCGDIIIDLKEREVFCEDRCRKAKGHKMMALLVLFGNHPNQLISKDRIIDAAWPEDEYPSQELLKTTISNLRIFLAKLGSQLTVQAEAGRYNTGWILRWRNGAPSMVRRFTYDEIEAFRRVLKIAEQQEPELVAMLRDKV